MEFFANVLRNFQFKYENTLKLNSKCKFNHFRKLLQRDRVGIRREIHYHA